ncbi:Dockerin type I repeat protein [Rubripirellula tenax]|uniref:Dockerin type I repeat protein n=1 Tax=Rubripirellula tenax TaxID=2528015 RepID=A0A5C6FLF3_9BACT|nr:dockerin type I domain-containing protein [Rubripirellula tenax]TWU60382.1 Dockerin type I repeat protein [Rubripirellula tenax]
MKKRRSNFESLETRQLLAAGLESCVAADFGVAVPPSSDVFVVGDNRIGESRIAVGMGSDEPAIGYDIALPVLFNPAIDFERYDALQQHGDRIYAIDRNPYSQTSALFVFRPNDEGALEAIAEVPLDFFVERMIVDGDQVLLLGRASPIYYLTTAETTAETVTPGPRVDGTIAVTITLGEETNVVRQSLDGVFQDAHYDDGRLVLTSADYDYDLPDVAGIPPFTWLLRAFELSDAGLQETATIELPYVVQTLLRGNELFVVTSISSHFEDALPDEPAPDDSPDDASGTASRDIPSFRRESSLTRYRFTDDGITEVSSSSLGSGEFISLRVSEDATTAVAIRVDQAPFSQQSIVDLLSFSDDSTDVFETVAFDSFHPSILHADSDYLVLQDWNDDVVMIISLDQTVDLALEDRVHKIEFGVADVWSLSAARLGDSLVVALPWSTSRPADDSTDMRAPTQLIPGAVVTIDLPSAEVVARTSLEGGLLISQFFVIDAEEQRFGFEQYNPAAFTTSRSFQFGRLNANGLFESEHAFTLDEQAEIETTTDHLAVTTSDQLIIRRWSDFENPIAFPLGDPDPVTTAVNDTYSLPTLGEEFLLEVLANDQIVGWNGDAQIVELIGAPQGTEIVRWRSISVPVSALRGVDSLEFQYTIQSGTQTSTATVRIEVISVDRDQIDALVDAVVARAAEDLGVSVEEIERGSVRTDYEATPPIVHLTVSTVDDVAKYTVDLDGQIEQQSVEQRELLVELALRAVDGLGDSITTIHEGDDFWLELTAKDLRPDGDGVYAAFFDLVVPEDQLALTGRLTYADEFGPIGPSNITRARIDDLGAISSEVTHPGNGLQSVLRVHVIAMAAGEVMLLPNQADEVGHETLLRGINEEPPASSIRYVPLGLTILPALVDDPLDIDGDGKISAVDALRVINFLGRYGSLTIDDVLSSSGEVDANGESRVQFDFTNLRRMDVNRNGTITALDALVIINRLGQVTTPADAESIDEIKLVTQIGD